MPTSRLPQELTRLRLAQLRRHWWVAINAVSRKAARREVAAALKGIGKAGFVETWPTAGPVRAALILTRVKPFYSRKPRVELRIIAAGGTHGADPHAAGRDRPEIRWIASRIRVHARTFRTYPEEIHLQLDVHDKELLPALRKAGFGIWFIRMGGDPKIALRELRRKYGDLKWQSHTDLELRPLKTAAQVEASIRLIRSEFMRNPQFGSFVASPGFLLQARKWLTAARRSRKLTNYVIYRNGKLVGQFDFTPTDASLFGKRAGGMSFTLDQSIQGQGLAKLMYAVLLERMVELDVRVMSGGTAQKPILKLARTMKRPPFAYLVRTSPAYFKPSHFNY